jgi:hypothetical protein
MIALKIKNPDATALPREAKEDWGRWVNTTPDNNR